MSSRHPLQTEQYQICLTESVFLLSRQDLFKERKHTGMYILHVLLTSQQLQMKVRRPTIAPFNCLPDYFSAYFKVYFCMFVSVCQWLPMTGLRNPVLLHVTLTWHLNVVVCI